jgi:hypothetical protein
LYCDWSGRCGNQPGSTRPIRPRNCRSELIPIAACATASATSSASLISGLRPPREGTGILVREDVGCNDKGLQIRHLELQSRGDTALEALRPLTAGPCEPAGVSHQASSPPTRRRLRAPHPRRLPRSPRCPPPSRPLRRWRQQPQQSADSVSKASRRRRTKPSPFYSRCSHPFARFSRKKRRIRTQWAKRWLSSASRRTLHPRRARTPGPRDCAIPRPPSVSLKPCRSSRSHQATRPVGLRRAHRAFVAHTR